MLRSYAWQYRSRRRHRRDPRRQHRIRERVIDLAPVRRDRDIARDRDVPLQCAASLDVESSISRRRRFFEPFSSANKTTRWSIFSALPRPVSASAASSLVPTLSCALSINRFARCASKAAISTCNPGTTIGSQTV